MSHLNQREKRSNINNSDELGFVTGASSFLTRMELMRDGTEGLLSVCRELT